MPERRVSLSPFPLADGRYASLPWRLQNEVPSRYRVQATGIPRWADAFHGLFVDIEFFDPISETWQGGGGFGEPAYPGFPRTKPLGASSWFATNPQPGDDTMSWPLDHMHGQLVRVIASFYPVRFPVDIELLTIPFEWGKFGRWIHGQVYVTDPSWSEQVDRFISARTMVR